MGEPKLLAHRLFGAQLQKRVVVEHLLNFLAQLQGGELQQTDGLLELWSQRQMLRHT